eukprot:NODE_243_length_11887_cov_0.520699.p5 type:complete len:259 gc:universal NODE_243_length_11887_cov_0.520699:11050-11826(+)
MIWILLIYAGCQVSDEYDLPKCEKKYIHKIKSLHQCELNEEEFDFHRNGFAFVDKFFDEEELKLEGISANRYVNKKGYKYSKKVQELVSNRFQMDVFCNKIFKFDQNAAIAPYPMHTDKEFSSSFHLDRVFSTFKDDLEQSDLMELAKFKKKNKRIDSITMWISTTNDNIENFPLALVPKTNSRFKTGNSAYYFKDMAFGQAIIFDNSVLHGSLGLRKKESQEHRHSVAFSCLKLPQNILTIVQSLEAKEQELQRIGG